MTPDPAPLAAVVLGTVRILTIAVIALAILVVLGVTIGLTPFAVPLLIIGWVSVIAFVTGAIRIKGDAP